MKWWTVILGTSLFLGLSLAGDVETPLKQKRGKDPLTHMPAIPELPKSIKDPAIWKNGTRLIFFYTPWCSYSQEMKPLLYNLIEELYYNNVSNILVGQIDVSIHSDVSRTFRIKSTPTLLLFRNGTRYEFIDDLTLDNLVKFVMKVLTHSLIELDSVSEVQSYLNEYSVIFLLVHDEEIHNDWQLMYQRVSEERALIGHFFYTTNSEIVNEMGFSLSSLPGLAVLKDGRLFQYEEEFSKYRMTLWVESEQFPALPTSNSSNLRYFASTGLVKRLVILVVSSEEKRSIKQKKAYEAVKQVAQSRKLHSGYQFVLLEDVEFAGSLIQQTLTVPALFVLDHRTGHYFPYELTEGSYSTKGVSSFLYSVTAGKIKVLIERCGQAIANIWGDFLTTPFLALGGPGLFSTINHWYWWTYNLIQIMFSHRPILSFVALILVVAGFFICMLSYRGRTKINPKRKEAIAKARARQREQLRKKQQQRRKEREREKEEDEDEMRDSECSSSEEEEKKNK